MNKTVVIQLLVVVLVKADSVGILFWAALLCFNPRFESINKQEPMLNIAGVTNTGTVNTKVRNSRFVQ